MIVYNSKKWLQFIFAFNKSDTLQKLWPALILIGLISWLTAYLEMNFLDLSEGNRLKNITVLHTLIGFVLSLLLVFRTNTAYDRWWEGRKLWGKLVNDSRNIAIQLDAFLPKESQESRVYFAKKLGLFPQVLHTHLTKESTRYSLDETEHPEFADIFKKNHPPSQTTGEIIEKINVSYKNGELTDIQFLTLVNAIQGLLDVCGGCERIKNTPIPYSYALFIKKFISIYVVTIPIGYVFMLGYWTIPVVIFLFYVLFSLEILAEEIEDPFSNDTNDLPTQKISDNIEKNINFILLDQG